MTAKVLNPREQKQWLKLRALRLERARSALEAAREAEADCQREVLTRRERIAATRADIHDLAVAVVDRWAAEMPRWADTVEIHRDVLVERLERDEYALIDDERKLEAAQEHVRQCQADVARAENRESAVLTLVAGMRRQALQQQELLVEREQEDRGHRPAAAAFTHATKDLRA